MIFAWRLFAKVRDICALLDIESTGLGWSDLEFVQFLGAILVSRLKLQLVDQEQVILLVSAQFVQSPRFLIRGRRRQDEPQGAGVGCKGPGSR
jgi:hypothetical protein